MNQTAPIESAASYSELTFDWINDLQAFQELEDDWNTLFDDVGRPSQVFQTYAWCWHWCNTYLDVKDGEHAATELYILTVRQHGKLVMIWPLMREQIGPLKQLSWLGDPVTQYGDVIVDNTCANKTEALLKTAWSELKSSAHADLMNLRKVRADSPLYNFLQTQKTVTTTTEYAPYIELSKAPSFDQIMERYSPRSRRNRRRLQRRLEKMGTITLKRPDSGDEAKKLAIRSLELKREWLASRGLLSRALADDRSIEFFSNLAGSKEKDTGCVVQAVCCDDVPVAIEISFLCKGSLHLHVTVFDLKFEKAGVGAFLLEDNIRTAFNDKIEIYDFLAPANKYKGEWSDASVAVSDWAASLSPKGTLWCHGYLKVLRPAMKSMFEKIPTKLRQRVRFLSLAL